MGYPKPRNNVLKTAILQQHYTIKAGSSKSTEIYSPVKAHAFFSSQAIIFGTSPMSPYEHLTQQGVFVYLFVCLIFWRGGAGGVFCDSTKKSGSVFGEDRKHLCIYLLRPAGTFELLCGKSAQIRRCPVHI